MDFLGLALFGLGEIRNQQVEGSSPPAGSSMSPLRVHTVVVLTTPTLVYHVVLSLFSPCYPCRYDEAAHHQVGAIRRYL